MCEQYGHSLRFVMSAIQFINVEGNYNHKRSLPAAISHIGLSSSWLYGLQSFLETHNGSLQNIDVRLET